MPNWLILEDRKNLAKELRYLV